MEWTHYLAPMLVGARVTMEITLASTLLGGVAAFLAGIGRAAGGPVVSRISIVYIEIFRGTSLLVQLFWLYYALPLVGPSFTPVQTGIVGLGLNIGAYGAEVVRGAILAVPRGQYEAAVALNLSRAHTLWRIVLPQAVIEMMPSLGNLVVQNLKDSALVSMIGLADLTFRAQAIRNLSLASTPVYTVALLLYFAMALVLMGLMRGLERWLRRRAALPRYASP
ncbi:MAG: ectoine/hydroxyectoine ABC transporter permease subunit EhuC [Rhodospirillales bacterium]|jgi:polar amino acid transport system permease protein|nr:ectoine/hydroxyectoine ABC transporter permease subunit EhuC [Rhodospirillales bacterium]